jgi:hypothetical protein
MVNPETTGGTKMRSNKKVALIVAAVAALLVLVAGTSLAVTAIQNNRNLASQRAAAAAVHHRAVIAHDKAAAAAKDKATAQAIARANRRAARAEKAAKAAANKAPTVVVVPPAPAGPAGLIYAGVGENGEAVYANSNTSSSFALNVEAAYVEGGYWYEPNISQFYAYSPTTGQDYFMTSSSAGNPVVVTGGNGALVQFDF